MSYTVVHHRDGTPLPIFECKTVDDAFAKGRAFLKKLD